MSRTDVTPKHRTRARRLPAAVAAVAALGAVAALLALGACSPPPPPAGEACPLMPQMRISRDVAVEHEGRRYFLCCEGCIDKFKANPDAIIEANPEWAAKSEPIEGR